MLSVFSVVKISLTTEDTENTEEMQRDPFTEKIIACAIEVHRTLGSGLLESTYQQCLAHEALFIAL